MPLTDEIEMQGYLTMELRDRQGAIVEEVKVKNAIVTDGRELVAKIFAGENIAKVSHLAVGTGGLSVGEVPQKVRPADRGLTKEVKRKGIKPPRVDLIAEGSDAGRWKVTLETELSAGDANGEALSEAGLFNGADNDPASKMYNRVTFKPINKSENFTLTLRWEIIF